MNNIWKVSTQEFCSIILKQKNYDCLVNSIFKNAVVCSLQFTEELFDKTSECDLTRLSKNAIPKTFIEPVTYYVENLISKPSDNEVKQS